VKFVSLPIGEIGVCTQKASPKKISIQMITLIALSRLIAMEEKPQTQRKEQQ